MLKNKHVRIGLFGVGAFVILCLGLNFLKGQDVFFIGDKFYAYYNDINGLTDASPVYYKGYKIGAVREINICPEQPAERRFEVVLAINISVDIPRDSRAEIYSTDILGGKGIDLVWGKSSETAEDGDELTSGVRVGLTEQLEPLKNKAELLAVRLDSALQGVTNLLGGTNGEQLAGAMTSLNATMKNIEGLTSNVARMTNRNGELNKAMSNLDTLMTTLKAQGGAIDTMMSSLAQFSKGLSESHFDSLIMTMNTTIEGIGNVMNDIDNAKGTLGKIINDSELYDNANRLLVDLRLNPSRYISISAMKFGKDIYVSTPEVQEAMQGAIYTVKLKTSKSPLDIPTEINNHKVMEYRQNNKYEYLLGIFRTKEEAEEVRREVLSVYPDSKLGYYENGVEKRLSD